MTTRNETEDITVDTCSEFRSIFRIYLKARANAPTTTITVRQGGVLSPVLFAIYIDVLVSRLRSVNIGCILLDVYFGCLLYADDIVLLAHSLNGMQLMLDICTNFGVVLTYLYL